MAEVVKMAEMVKMPKMTKYGQIWSKYEITDMDGYPQNDDIGPNMNTMAFNWNTFWKNLSTSPY